MFFDEDAPTRDGRVNLDGESRQHNNHHSPSSLPPMPPRRSSRTRASVEPTPPETLPAKRKRGSTAEPTTEEKENIAKPSSKRPGRTSAPSSKGRAVSKAKNSLPKVEEGAGGEEEEEEEEEEVQAPAKKKARPSVEHESEPEDDEEPVQPVRARRSNRASVKMEVDEDGATLSQPTKRTAAKRTKAGTKKAMVKEEATEEEEDDVKPPVRGSRRSKKLVVEDDDDEEKEDVPSKGSKKGTQNRRSKARVSIEEPTKDEDEGSEDDIEVIPLRKSRKAPPPTQPEPQIPEEEEEEEEEHSLFEPISVPAPDTLPQSVPEQPSGPQARLVIHKIVLVNFKSYAGRQEIGPFHKVSHTVYSFLASAHFPVVVVLSNSRTQRFWKVKHDRCAPFRIWIPGIKDASRQGF